MSHMKTFEEFQRDKRMNSVYPAHQYIRVQQELEKLNRSHTSCHNCTCQPSPMPPQKKCPFLSLFHCCG